jgi:hypothetical protein
VAPNRSALTNSRASPSNRLATLPSEMMPAAFATPITGCVSGLAGEMFLAVGAIPAETCQNRFD